MIEEYRDVIANENARWTAEPPPPPIPLVNNDSSGTSRWASAKGNLEAYVTGDLEGATPKGGVVGTVQSSAAAGSIYSRSVLGIASNVIAAINALVRGDDAGAAAHLSRIEEHADTYRRDTDQYVKEQFATGAGQATGEGLLKQFAQ